MRSPARDPGALATILLTVLSIAVLGMVLWLRVALPTEGATIPTADWDWDTSGATILPARDPTVFRPGDRVVEVAGRSLETWAEMALGGGTGPSTLPDPLPVVVDRAGGRVALDASLATFPIVSSLAGSWPVVAFTVAQAALASWLLLRRPRNLPIRILFVGSVANLASALPWQLGMLPTDLVRGWPTVLSFAATGPLDLVFWSSLLHLILVYPRRSPVLTGRPWLPAALYVVPIGGLLVGAVVLRLATISSLLWIGSWVSLQAWVVLAVLGVSLASLAVALQRLPGPFLRGMRWVVAALIAAALGAMILVVVPLAATGTSIAPRGVLGLLALPIPIAMSVAIARDRMFERDQLLRSRERLVTAREDERRRLRRRLHDGIGPALAAMTIRLDLASDQVSSDPVAAVATLGELKQQTQAVLSDIRTIARDLRPPALDDLGLVGALRRRAEELTVESRSGVRVNLVVDGDLPELPAAVEVAAYRIASEAMLNAVRHAAGSTCTVHLATSSPLLLEIDDDGDGIRPERPPGVGIAAMRERAAELGGTLEIEARAGGGTRVVATLPWQA